MRNHFKALLCAAFLCAGQTALATPQSDAKLIAQRSTDWSSIAQDLKKAFVQVYFRPISKQGVEIADEDKFAALIPDDDIAPYIRKLAEKGVENYLKLHSPERLAMIAAILRADEEATVKDILDEENQQRSLAALEKARAEAVPSGADDPLTLEIEEITVRLKAFYEMLEGKGSEQMLQDLAFALRFATDIISYAMEIQQREVRANNPVTIAAIKTNGVLSFANPVQRQTLLRQLSGPKREFGIQFKKPPLTRAASN